MRVAVVGSGVAGISTAYHLRKHGPVDLEVVLYESSSEKIGGHACTVKTESMAVSADAGFMVCNHDTYPNLLRWFADLRVPLERTDMSFCVTDDGDRTWSFGWGLVAWLKMLPTKRFWLWVVNMDRFHKEALAALEEEGDNSEEEDEGYGEGKKKKRRTDADETILEWLTSRGYHESVVQGWLIPFCEAVWSSPSSAAGSMNAKALFVFLRNHGFLSWRVPHWLTPKARCGGYYLKRAEEWFGEHDVKIVLGAKVVGASRKGEKKSMVELVFEDGNMAPERFDKVVFAAPAGALNNTALAALRPDWQGMLSGFRTHSSEVVLHSDAQVMPKLRSWWASWTVAKGGTFTYWLNNLQHQSGPDLFETLNPKLSGMELDESKVHGRFQMTHPVMDKRTLVSQQQYFAEANEFLWKKKQKKAKGEKATGALRGTDAQRGNEESDEEELNEKSVFLAGAYLHHGFHEDGFRSGIEACRSVLEDPSVPLLPVPFARIHPVHHTFKGFTHHARLAAPKTDDQDKDQGGGGNEEESDGLHSKVTHAFKYPVTYDYVDVSGCPRYWWGGLHREDHFGDPCVELHEEVRRRVCQETGTYPSGSIDLLCSLRAYGYCFNPISLFFVWSEDQSHHPPSGPGGGDTGRGRRVEFVVSEVTSTPWEQRTVHVLDLRTSISVQVAGKEKQTNAENKAARKFVRPKSIHVSPFNPVPDGDQVWEYTFHDLPGDDSGAHSQDKVHMTVTLFGDAQRLANRQATVIADLNVARVRVDTTKTVRGRLEAILSTHKDPHTWWAAWLLMLLPLAFPHAPPVPWAVVNQLRIHFEAFRLAFKGLKFTPNTAWSAAPKSSKPLHFKKSGGGGGCPVFCGAGGGPGARTAPCFLERLLLGAWAATLLSLVLFGFLGKALAAAVFLSSSLVGLQVSASVLPPDVTGRCQTL